jgi:hypothetical protein
MRFRIKALKTRVVLIPLDRPDDTLTEEEAIEVENWVAEHNYGKRVAHDQWQLNDYKCLLVFKLKWS